MPVVTRMRYDPATGRIAAAAVTMQVVRTQPAEWRQATQEQCPRCTCDECFRPLIEYPFRTVFFVHEPSSVHLCQGCYQPDARLITNDY